MVFPSICEHASSVYIFTSTRSCQIFLASSEHLRKIQMARSKHFRKYRWRAAGTLEKIQMASSEHFEYFVNFPLAGISLLVIGYVVLPQIIANNLADTSKTEQ